MKLNFLIFGLIFSLYSNAQVLVNEYSAANYDDHLDNQGYYEDWFELYNPSATDINLEGYYLSDKENNLVKWAIPAGVTIQANDYLLIYCSGKNGIYSGDVHTNFKLHQTKGNEWIILTNPDGATVEDSIFVKPCLTNSSRGRISDANVTWGVFTNPTPNAANINSFTGYAPTPQFSITSGIYPNAINVDITGDPNTTIYYTTDGSVPDDGDLLYTGPIAVNNTTVLKTIAYSADPNILPSFINFGTYFINISHNLKILSVSGRESNNLANPELYELIAGGVQIEPIGTFELYNPDGTLIDKARGEFNEHGNDSWAYQQRGFDYITRDQFGYNYAIKGELFNGKDRDRFQKLIIKCGANDNYPFSYGSSGAHIRDPYVQSLSQVADLRMDERSYEPCVMYLNGQYWGVYELREKVDDLDFTDYYYDQDSIEMLKTWGGTWADALYDGQTQASVQASWDNVRNYITSNDMSVQANYDYAKSVYNTGSLIDYYILNTYTVNADWLNWNTAWWHGLLEDGDKKKWRYILWDMDNTFDHGANYTGIDNTDFDADPCDAESLGNIGGQGHIPIWNALLQNEEFFDDFINRWADLSNTYFSCEFMINHLDSLINNIEPEMQAQIDRWGGTYAEWESNVQYMRDFMNNRCAILNAAVVDCYDVEGPYNITVVIEGVGEVELNDISINEANSPWNGTYFGGVDIDFSVISGNYSFYEITSSDNYNYNPNDTDFTVDMLGDLTITFYFNTNDVMYLVNPPNTANLNINGTIVNSFPHTETYLDNESISVNAVMDPNWEVDNWTSLNHTLNPNNTSQSINFDIFSSDTIVLNTKPKIYQLTFVKNPNNANAELILNGNSITNFPHTIQAEYNTLMELEANSNTYWEFINFTSQYHLLGNAQNDNISFNVENNDTITLNYDENIFYNLTFRVEPDMGGQILVDNIPYANNQSEVFNEDVVLNLTAIPTNGWSFEGWSSERLNINNLDENSSVVVDNSGIITATFKEIFQLYIPNSFTPNNGDYSHNTFDISIFTVNDYTFEFKVYTRYSELVFESTDINNSWDGKHMKTNADLPIGLYIYQLNVVSKELNKNIEEFGTIHLIR